MKTHYLDTVFTDDKLSLKFSGELNLHTVPKLQERLNLLNLSSINHIEIDLDNLSYFDTAASIFINNLIDKYKDKNIEITIKSASKDIQDTLNLVSERKTSIKEIVTTKKESLVEVIGKSVYEHYLSMISFIGFLGKLFSTKLYYMKSFKNIRYKEIAFEINESAIKALPIIALTSFLIGVVVAYQSSYQLKIYGANIFLIDMLGISMLRELAPLITAIVIAGRSGSAFTAQIGAMKITQEIDAMRTMGFDPYVFLVLPRVIALIIAMPVLIFIADVMGVLGGMVVANLDLGISPTLFIDRFSEVVDVKHFFIGIFKGPFFAFLIAAIGIYRGMRVKDDTQSIGFNTTKSVVEAIFAVIMCDAFFSIAFTNLGI